MGRKFLPTITAFLAAFGAIAAATLCTLFVYRVIGAPTLLFFVLAAALSSWYGGLKFGRLTTLLCIIVIGFLLHHVNPFHSIAANLVELVAFALTVAVLTWLTAFQRRSAQAVREQYMRFAATLSQMGEAVIITDSHGNITFMNTIAETLTGWLFEEASQRPLNVVFSIIDEVSRQAILKTVGPEVAVGLLTPRQTLLVAKGGVERLVESRAAYLQEPSSFLGGKPGAAGLALIFHDITERQQIEQRMRQNEERMRAILENMPVMITALNADGTYAVWNREAELVTGYSAEDMLGNPNAVAWLYPDSAYYQKVRAAWAKMTGDFRNFETEIVRRDGERRTVAWSSISRQFPIAGWSGWGIGVDVTDQKRAENTQKLLTEVSTILVSSLDYEVILHNLVEFLGTGFAELCTIYLLDDNGDDDDIRVMRASALDPEMQNILEELDKTFKPRRDNDILMKVLQLGQSRFIPEMQHSIIDDGVPDEHNRALLKRLNIRSTIVVPLKARGRILGAMTLTTTQSGRRFTADDLADAEEIAWRTALAIDNADLYRKAQQAVTARDEFLSVAAHELKTPVTSMRGFAQMMVRQRDEDGTYDIDRAKRAFERIDQQATRLSHLVTQLLDISRIEAGKLVLDRKPADVKSLVESVVATAQFNAQRHQIVIETPDSVPAIVDSLRLEQVITNLLDNAIKFSPDGGKVEVEVRVNPHETGSAKVLISVTDHGIGIDPAQRPYVFDRFYQANSKNYLGGMGLGLYISREIVRLHGGDIDCDGLSQGGTRFTVHLPIHEMNQS